MKKVENKIIDICRYNIESWGELDSNEVNFFKNNEFIHQMMFVAFKEIWPETRERKTIKNFVEEGDETGKRTMNRHRKEVIDRTKKDREQIGVSEKDYYLKNFESDRASNSYPTYDSLDVRAINNIKNGKCSQLINIFKDGNIIQHGKEKARVSGEKIYDAYKSYVDYLEEGNRATDPTEWLERLFDIASLEENLNVNLAYQLADYMEKHNEKPVPPEIGYLCGCVKLFKCDRDGRACGRLHSRFLQKRVNLIPQFYENPQRAQETMAQWLYNHSLINKLIKMEKDNLKLTIKEIPNEDIAAYFRTNYNLFTSFSIQLPKKKFTAKKVKCIRDAAKLITDELSPVFICKDGVSLCTYK